MAFRPCCLQPLRLVDTPPLTPSSAQAQRGSAAPGCGSLTVTVTGGVTVGGGLGAAGGGLTGGGTTVTGAGAAPVVAGASGPQGTQAAPRMELGVARAHLVPPIV